MFENKHDSERERSRLAPRGESGKNDMGLLDHLERRLRRFAMPNLTGYLAGFQAALWLLAFAMPPRGGQGEIFEGFLLIPANVMQGEIWRLATFVFLPPGHSIWAIFGIYMFWLMGNALEGQWGAVRYNLYLLIAVLATIAVAFLLPNGGAATNAFINSSVFLAFAYLFPNFTIYIYWILPVKMKWIALLTWIWYAFELAEGDWPRRAYVLISVCNFLLFFGGDIFQRMRSGKRRMETTFRKVVIGDKPFHTCAICGMTERDEPSEDFRICSKCDIGTFEYCSQHLRNHEHRVQESSSSRNTL